MARNQVQKGDVLTFSPVPAGGVTSGEGLLIGAAFGVCQTDADAAGEVEAAVEGVHALPKWPARSSWARSSIGPDWGSPPSERQHPCRLRGRRSGGRRPNC